jgi:hypothetical protein
VPIGDVVQNRVLTSNGILRWYRTWIREDRRPDAT